MLGSGRVRFGVSHGSSPFLHKTFHQKLSSKSKFYRNATGKWKFRQVRRVGAQNKGHGLSMRIVCENIEGDDEKMDKSSPEEANKVTQQCIECLLQRNRNALLEFVPDNVCETCLEKKESTRREGSMLKFEDIPRFNASNEFLMDSYATRLLTCDSPTSITVMSSMMLDAASFIQRWHVVGQFGEQAILMVKLSLQDTLLPAYRGWHMSKCWMLASITGEPPETDIETVMPDPAWPPELVIEAQLEALRVQDASRVFEFASTTNKMATGPVERFSDMLQTKPYAPLLAHSKREVLNAKTLETGRYVELIGVHNTKPGGGLERFLYLFVLQRESDGDFKHSWLTESVHPINISALQKWGMDFDQLL